MRKLSTFFILIPVLVLMNFASGFGQIEVQVGNGTTDFQFPFYTTYHDANTTMLYKADEIDAPGGPIKTLSFHFTANTGLPMNGLTIKMQNTSLQTTAGGYVADGWTTVWGPYSYTPTPNGWRDFVLDEMFMWDGTSNILINICLDNTVWSGSWTVFSHSVTSDRYTFARYQDGGQGCTTLPDFGGFYTVRPNIKFKFATSVTGLYPEQGVVLRKNAVYQLPDVNHPGYKIVGLPAGTPATMTYKISGPGNDENIDYQTIYRAVSEIDPSNQNLDVTNSLDNVTYRITEATGLAALTNPENNGGLDFVTNNINLKGGEYTAEAVLTIPSWGYVSNPTISKFTLALNHDIAIISNTQPINGDIKELSRGWVPSVITVQNLGVDSVYGFNIYAQYSHKAQNGTNFVTFQRDTLRWRAYQGNNVPMAFAEKKVVTLPNIIYSAVGDVKSEYYVEMIGEPDQDLSNNTYPRGGKDLIFNVTYSVEVYADTIIVPNPNSKYYKGVPFTPFVRFGNNGFADTTDVATVFRIYKLNSNGVRVLKRTLSKPTEDLIRKGFGRAIYDEVILDEEGTYLAEAEIIAARDPFPSNNIILDTFYVTAALSGEYTVGTRFAGQARNFATLEDVQRNVMEKGLDGPTTFKLTDDNYTVGLRTELNEPAIDFSSSIVGGSKSNWIKFMPHPDKYYNRASININIISSSGVGFKFGQNDYPSEPEAAVFKSPREVVRRFANPTASVIFDGGPYNAIKFNMNTTNARRTVLYFGPGSSNDTVRNCIFTDISPTPSYQSMVPLSYFDAGKMQFLFDLDNTATGTISAAIVFRSTVPYDNRYSDFRNNNGLDTLENKNNLIIKNEISGFSIGIASLGIGPLMDAGRGELKPFYNKNNKIISNIIYDVKRAGVVVGFEDSTNVRNNVIFNINGISSVPVSAGIIAGGEGRGYTGFYNTNLKIVANEIYNVSGDQGAYGVLYEGILNKYATGNSLVEMPNQNENIEIYNNVIRDISALNVNTDRFGILVKAPRQNNPNQDKFTNFSKAANLKHLLRNALIANNTIIINNDPINNIGLIAGIGALNIHNAKIYSNAIAIQDLSIDTSVTEVASCIVMTGPFPFKPAYLSDRNAYELAPGTQASIYRYIETDSTNRITELGYVNEYINLQQWQNWTFQDMNSIQGRFTQDLTINRVGQSYTTLRVKLSPLPPMSSILNNAGEQLTNYIPRDIDSNFRGEANQRYDIGASEFSGRVYSEDVSVENIIEPRRYQAGSGVFADAQYIMQLPPYRIEAVTRNNGMLPRSNVNARILLYVEAANGTFVLIDSVDKFIGIAPNDITNVSHEFPNSFDTLFPRSYSDFIKMANANYSDPAVRQRMMTLYNYNVPATFKGMENNVTPRYKLRVQLMVAEARYDNDYYEKFVRYFVPKSNASMLVSGENIATNIVNQTPTLDQIAGRLNYDSLRVNLNKVGFYSNPDSLNNYDVFDRNGWEAKAVDYNLYVTLFWTDGDDKPITKTQINDVKKYFNSTFNDNFKRNFIVASQEMSREITNPNYYQYDSLFAKDILRAMPANPKSPLINPNGTYASYHGHKIHGSSLQINGFTETDSLMRTTFPGDADPYPGNITPITSGGDAVSFPAYMFDQVAPGATDSTMGVATTSIYKNIVYLTADWRHINPGENVLRSILDFLNRNGGIYSVPVELADFDAIKVNNTVQLGWKTIYELNSNRFELEKAVSNYSGVSPFKVIETVAAGKTSSLPLEYGPFIDREVNVGNKYIYRLKIIDNDGTYSYSNEIEIDFDNNQLSFIKVSPNPVDDVATIIFNAAGKANVDVSIFDITGKKVQTIFNGSAHPGNNEAFINSSELSNGTYTIVITDGTHTINKQIVVKK